jgi:hypothetical protein
MSDTNSITRFCKKCQTETERKKNGECKVCAKAYAAAWQIANIEKKRGYNAAYYAANIEKNKVKCAAWYTENSGKAKARVTAWNAANPAKKKANATAWNKANIEARRIYKHNRSVRTSGGVLSKGLSAKLFKLQKGKCACCGLPLGVNFHLDHVVPLALGGSNTDDNIQLLRATCNLQKQAKHPVDFMQERGFLL